jgi:endogenous inhibitor of DNA gyrase (YacG/DUF329 family)
MSLKSAPYFWVECDGCGDRCEYGDFAAWADADYAIDGATEADWTELDGKHHCPSCPELIKCERCGKEAGPGAADRDDRCAECWALVEAGAS